VATRASNAGFDARRVPEAPAHDAGLASAPRVAVYLYVSTGRQAEHDLSIPDLVVERLGEAIVGRKDVLQQAVLANGGTVLGVRSLVRKWRTRQDETASTYVIETAIRSPRRS
jgi:hypothetical protein